MTYKETLLDELNNKLHLGLDNRPLSIEEQEEKKRFIEDRLSWLEMPSLLIKSIAEHQHPRNRRYNNE